MIAQSLIDLLQCPECSAPVGTEDDKVVCPRCSSSFPILDGVPLMVPHAAEPIKAQMHEFWGKGYEYRFAEFEKDLTPEQLREQLANAERESIAEGHFVGHEIRPHDVAGKLCLEIGCGGGGQGLIFATQGAEMVSTDLCLERTLPAWRKLQMIGPKGHACQADAEFLPFRNESFDIVFSQGVLHHTPRTETALAHVLRVLKPGGTAYIGLYARHSFMYYVTELLYMGVLRGNLLRYGRDWLSAVTEMAQVRPGAGRNPVTRVYSRRQVQAMFREFSHVTIRKSDFHFSQIPGFERLEARLHPERYLPRAPRRLPTSLERALGPVIGWSLYITAMK